MPPHTRRFQPLSSSVSVPACVSVSVPVAMPVADALPRPGALSDARRPVAIPRISSTELKAALSRFLGALSRVQVRLSEVDWDEARDGREGRPPLLAAQKTTNTIATTTPPVLAPPPPPSPPCRSRRPSPPCPHAVTDAKVALYGDVSDGRASLRGALSRARLRPSEPPPRFRSSATPLPLPSPLPLRISNTPAAQPEPDPPLSA